MKKKLANIFVFLVNLFSGLCFADVIDPNDPYRQREWPWRDPEIPIEPVPEPVPEPEVLPDEIAKVVIGMILIISISITIYYAIKYLKNDKRRAITE